MHIRTYAIYMKNYTALELATQSRIHLRATHGSIYSRRSSDYLETRRGPNTHKPANPCTAGARRPARTLRARHKDTHILRITVRVRPDAYTQACTRTRCKYHLSLYASPMRATIQMHHIFANQQRKIATAPYYTIQKRVLETRARTANRRRPPNLKKLASTHS